MSKMTDNYYYCLTACNCVNPLFRVRKRDNLNKCKVHCNNAEINGSKELWFKVLNG